jgi:hypothetical protein
MTDTDLRELMPDLFREFWKGSGAESHEGLGIDQVCDGILAALAVATPNIRADERRKVIEELARAADDFFEDRVADWIRAHQDRIEESPDNPDESSIEPDTLKWKWFIGKQPTPRPLNNTED